jgi:hypothetical protein
MRHAGPCGRRIPCFRPDCRQQFHAAPTIEILPNAALAYCHRVTLQLDDPRLGQAL